MRYTDECPCDVCSFFGGHVPMPEEMKCTEDEQDTYNCPYWNPEPLTCVSCGKQIYRGDMCEECEKEEARLQFESNDGEFEYEGQT